MILAIGGFVAGLIWINVLWRRSPFKNSPLLISHEVLSNTMLDIADFYLRACEAGYSPYEMEQHLFSHYGIVVDGEEKGMRESIHANIPLLVESHIRNTRLFLMEFTVTKIAYHFRMIEDSERGRTFIRNSFDFFLDIQTKRRQDTLDNQRLVTSELRKYIPLNIDASKLKLN